MFNKLYSKLLNLGFKNITKLILLIITFILIIVNIYNNPKLLNDSNTINNLINISSEIDNILNSTWTSNTWFINN